MFTRSDLSADGSINTQEERETLNDEVFKRFKRFEPTEGEILDNLQFNICFLNAFLFGIHRISSKYGTGCTIFRSIKVCNFMPILNSISMRKWVNFI